VNADLKLKFHLALIKKNSPAHAAEENIHYRIKLSPLLANSQSLTNKNSWQI